MSESPPTNVYDVTEATFERDVLAASQARPIVVDFWAEWCGPCRHLGPMLEQLIEERAGAIALAKVNVENEPRLAQEFRIDSIPAVVAFRNRKPVHHFVGLLPETHLRAFLDAILPSEADRLAQEAMEREATDPAGAEAGYRAALERENDHAVAVVGLARLLIARGEIEEAEALLDRLPPRGEQALEAERLRGLLKLRGLASELPSEAEVQARLATAPEDGTARYQMGCHLAVAGRLSEALDLLLQAAETDKALASGPVKHAMVEIFHVLGPDSELASTSREKLVRLLY